MSFSIWMFLEGHIYFTRHVFLLSLFLWYDQNSCSKLRGDTSIYSSWGCDPFVPCFWKQYEAVLIAFRPVEWYSLPLALSIQYNLHETFRISIDFFFVIFLFVFILSDGCFIFIHLLKVESRNIKAVDPLSKHSFCGWDPQEHSIISR